MQKITNLQQELNNSISLLYNDIQNILNTEYLNTSIQYSCRIQYNKMFKIFDIAILNMSDSNSDSSIIKEPYYNLLYANSFANIKVVQDILNKF